MSVMDHSELLELAQSRVVERRNRMSQNLKERLAQNRETASMDGVLRGSRFFVHQEAECAKDLVARADHWLTIYKEVLDAGSVVVDSHFLVELNARLRQEIATDSDQLYGVLANSIKPVGATTYTGELDVAQDRQLKHIEAELRFYALESQSRVVPLAQALAAARYDGVREFWEKGLALQREGDPSAACKEAISAVEAAGQIVLGNDGLTLGDILKRLRNKSRVSPTIVSAIEKLWGFVNETPGVRHGSPQGIRIDVAEAQFLLDGAAAALRFFLSLDRGT